MEKTEIRLAVMEILSDGVERATGQILAEISSEFPELLKALMDTWGREYGFGCGAIQYPLTIISQTLEDLARTGEIIRTRRDTLFYVSKGSRSL